MTDNRRTVYLFLIEKHISSEKLERNIVSNHNILISGER